MEQKKLTCKILNPQFDEADDEFFTFEGYASTFGNIDRGSDIVQKGSFLDTIEDLKRNAVPITGTNFSALLPILWQHDTDIPIGSFVEIREDNIGLFVKGIMPKTDDFVMKRVVPQLRVYSVSQMSIGFLIEQESMDGNVRNIEKTQLFEVSLVTIPMNPQARITQMKAAVPFQDLPLADRDRAWDADAAISRVRDFTNSQDAPTNDYRRAFLFFDENNPELFTSYKLPIADVIDGRLMAVPRAIFAAAAAIQGARGGTDLSDSDRNSIINNLNRYYDKLGLPSPFRESMSFRVDDVSSLTERQLESLFKNGVFFSQSMAKKMVSALTKPQRDDEVKGFQWDVETKANLKKLLELLN